MSENTIQEEETSRLPMKISTRGVDQVEDAMKRLRIAPVGSCTLWRLIDNS